MCDVVMWYVGIKYIWFAGGSVYVLGPRLVYQILLPGCKTRQPAPASGPDQVGYLISKFAQGRPTDSHTLLWQHNITPTLKHASRVRAVLHPRPVF